MRFIRIAVLVAVVLGIGALVFVLSNSKPEPEVEEEIKIEDPLVELIQPSEFEQNTSTLAAYGVIEAVKELDLSFTMNGTVQYVYIKPGQHVRTGQAIALLENRAMGAQVEQVAAAFKSTYNNYLAVASGNKPEQINIAKSQLRAAEQQLEALYDAESDNPLLPIDNSVQIELQEELILQQELNIELLSMGADRNQLAAQWALVEQSRAALNNVVETYKGIILRAPFEGDVITIDLTPGQIINPGQIVGTIVNQSNIEVVAYLPQEAARKISTNNNVWIEDRYEGKVVGISSKVNQQTQKRKVRIQIERLGSMTLGETVYLEIEENRIPNVVLLPFSALIFDEDSQSILVYEKGKLVQTEIVTGRVSGDMIQVLGVPKKALVRDVKGLEDGQSVRIQQ